MPPENKQFSPAGLASLGFGAHQLGAFEDISGKKSFLAGIEKDLSSYGAPTTPEQAAAIEASLDAQLAAKQANPSLGFSQGGGEVYSGVNVPVESFALDSAPWTAGLPSAVPAESLMMPEAMLGSADVVGGVAPAVEVASAAPAVEAGLGAAAAEGAAGTAAAEAGLLGAGALGPLAAGAVGIYALGSLLDLW